MNDFTRINAPRVEKIVDAVKLIGRSARSQRATDAEIEPMATAIREACGEHLLGIPSAPAQAAPEPSPEPARPTDRLDAVVASLTGPSASRAAAAALASASPYEVQRAALALPLTARAKLLALLAEDIASEAIEAA